MEMKRTENRQEKSDLIQDKIAQEYAIINSYKLYLQSLIYVY